jgi:hypothetical protein
VARIGEKRNTQRILVRKPEGERPYERSRRRWEYNIILYLKETEWKNLVGLFGSTQKKLRAWDVPIRTRPALKHSRSNITWRSYYITPQWKCKMRIKFFKTSHTQRNTGSLPSWISLPLRMEPIGCPKTLVRIYDSTLHKIPVQHTPHLHRGGGLKSCTTLDYITHEKFLGSLRNY